MKLSSIYGKRIISAAGKEGYVLSVNATGCDISCLVCADENEREFAVDFKSVKILKNKIVYGGGVRAQKRGKPLRLGTPAYDYEGTFIGKVTDYTIDKNAVILAHVGNKKFSADDIVCGDAVIIKSTARILKSDVKSGGKIFIRKGTPLTPELVEKAQKKGEYIQTNLKTLI